MVEGTALEKRHMGNRIVSSNLTASATELFKFILTRAVSSVVATSE